MKATWLLLAGAVCALAPHSAAQCQTAGSLLLYPEFDNTDGVRTILTVTNTSDTDEINTEIIYIDHYDCSEFNREIALTPNDTFTFITNFHNPQDEKGYAYLFAKDEDGDAVSFNWLVGHALRIDAWAITSAVNPVVYQGVGDQGTKTDVDGDGELDMDGTEYSENVDVVIIPRFLGQNEKSMKSRLIFVALTGGSQFDTTVDFLIYNDNEEVFSSEYTFYCWKRVKLTDISGIFSNSFLKMNTNHAMNEIWGWNMQESGWMQIDGAVASSSTTSIMDPAFVAVLDEGFMDRRGRDLPFGRGTQDNGTLLPRSNDGDQD